MQLHTEHSGIISSPSWAQLHKPGRRTFSYLQKSLLKCHSPTHWSQVQKPCSGCDRPPFLVGSMTHSQKVCPRWADSPSLCSNCIQGLWPCGTNPSPPALWVEPFTRHFPFHHPMPPQQRAPSPCTSSPAHSPHMLGCPYVCSYSLRSSPYLVHSQLSLQLGIFCFVTRPIFQHKEDLLVMSWHSSPPSAHSPFFLAPYDLRCLSFTHLTDLLPSSLVLDLQDQAGIFLHPPSGPIPFGALIFRLQRWQGVREFDTANAVTVRWTEK